MHNNRCSGRPITPQTNSASPMQHLVLLGDSILDNGAYTAGGPAVIEQVRAILPTDGEHH